MSESLPATTRAMASVPPPGGNGTIRRTNRFGQAAVGCAAARVAKAGTRAPRAPQAPMALAAGDHSLTLMLAALMTGAHFSISVLKCAPSSSGVEPTTITPS